MNQMSRLEAAIRKWNLLVGIDQYPGEDKIWVSITRILPSGRELTKCGYCDNLEQGIKEGLDYVESSD